MVRSRSLRIGGGMVPLRWHDLRLDRSMKGMDMVRGVSAPILPYPFTRSMWGVVCQISIRFYN